MKLHARHLRIAAPTAVRRAFAYVIVAACLLSTAVFAHPGGVDDDGCHVEAKTQARHCHPKSAFDTSRPPQAGDEGVFFGPLVAVKDGDTVQVKVQGVVMDFRLADIDAPESNQPYGERAKQELAALIGRNQCVLVPIDTDRYGRTVALLWSGDHYVNRELVKRGAAWFNSEFASDASLADAEHEARSNRRGLWSLPPHERIEPWVWRRTRNGD